MGAEAVVRRLGPRELDVLVDGAQVERLSTADELFTSSPGLAFRVGDQVYHETFGASAEAIDALRTALESGRPAPADSELLLDGLVDRDLGLTPRGRRALALAPPSPPGAVAATESPIEIVTRGPVGGRARERLRGELARLVELTPRPALLARGSLSYDENPSLARPAEAKATIDLGGRTVRAHATAAGTAEAIDLLVGRLRRALRELRERQEAERRGPGVAEPGHWRHGNLPPPRPGPLPAAPPSEESQTPPQRHTLLRKHAQRGEAPHGDSSALREDVRQDSGECRRAGCLPGRRIPDASSCSAMRRWSNSMTRAMLAAIA